MTTVFVGLSGGVDSATSAALLKERGYDVIGAFIKIWQPEFIECTWREDRLDAMRICASLGIPFREINLSDEYQKRVVDSMIADYRAGITPNPDVLCNEKIKFGSFFSWALSEGADFVATGHYARIEGPSLARAVDANKDQSYFLHRISSEELARTIFPIGDLHKDEVREHAKRFNLPVAAKPDSQGLCFVGDVSMRDFLKRFIVVENGPVLDMQGNQIGTHEGAALYTLGQRHGFTVKNGPAEGSHYVVAIDTAKNAITVSRERSDAARKEISMRDIHWIGETPGFPVRLQAQTRYREIPVAVTIEKDSVARFDEPHIASPGQSIVLYDGDICLGGAFIV